MNAVTGVGPRTGTSWVMGKLKEAGLEVHGQQYNDHLWVRKHNPQGYWDLGLGDPLPESGVAKVWGVWKHPHINRVVVLRRNDTQAQLRSMAKVFRDEKKLEAYKDLELAFMNPSEVLLQYLRETTRWLKTRDTSNTMLVTTENLDNEIDGIIEFLKEDI